MAPGVAEKRGAGAGCTTPATSVTVNSDTSITAISPGEGNPDTVGVTVVTVVGEVLVPAGGVLVVGFATVVGGEPEVTGAEPTEVDGTVVVTSCPFPGDGTWSPGGADPDAPEPEPAAPAPPWRRPG